MGKWVCFGALFFNWIPWIKLCDKKNLTFVDCCDKILLNSSWKNVIELAKGSLNNVFQGSFHKTLSQQLTHDRSYMSVAFFFHSLVRINRRYSGSNQRKPITNLLHEPLSHGLQHKLFRKIFTYLHEKIEWNFFGVCHLHAKEVGDWRN